MGWEQFEARRRVVAAEQVGARTSVDGAVLPARLPATGEVFTAGKASLRHVEVIARVLGSRAAARLTPDQWAGVEGQLAAKTDQYSPTELHRWGTALVEMLDQDGEAPDDGPPPGVNELFITRNRSGSGGRIKGRFDDAAMFEAIAALLDAKAKPRPVMTTAPPGSGRRRRWPRCADGCSTTPPPGWCPTRVGSARR